MTTGSLLGRQSCLFLTFWEESIQYGVVNQDLFDRLGGKRQCWGANQIFVIRLDQRIHFEVVNPLDLCKCSFLAPA